MLKETQMVLSNPELYNHDRNVNRPPQNSLHSHYSNLTPFIMDQADYRAEEPQQENGMNNDWLQKK